MGRHSLKYHNNLHFLIKVTKFAQMLTSISVSILDMDAFYSDSRIQYGGPKFKMAAVGQLEFVTFAIVALEYDVIPHF